MLLLRYCSEGYLTSKICPKNKSFGVYTTGHTTLYDILIFLIRLAIYDRSSLQISSQISWFNINKNARLIYLQNVINIIFG